MITPEQIGNNSEHASQTALFCWSALPYIRSKYPELELMFAVPNGGHRDKRTASNLRAEGVKAGVLDIFLPVARRGAHGLWLEMKNGDNKLTDEQLRFGRKVTDQGYVVIVHYNWEGAVETLKWYLT